MTDFLIIADASRPQPEFAATLKEMGRRKLYHEDDSPAYKAAIDRWAAAWKGAAK